MFHVKYYSTWRRMKNPSLLSTVPITSIMLVKLSIYIPVWGMKQLSGHLDVSMHSECFLGLVRTNSHLACQTNGLFSYGTSPLQFHLAWRTKILWNMDIPFKSPPCLPDKKEFSVQIPPCLPDKKEFPVQIPTLPARQNRLSYSNPHLACQTK